MGSSGVRRIVGTVVCAGLLTACTEGTRETDRQAKTLADAISWPRQSSAAGFARAALATPLGKSPNFSVLEARDLDAKQPTDPLAHLVIRIHNEGSDSGFSHVDPVTACYSMDFNYYGVIGTPSRITCPLNAVPITPPPEPRRDIPPGYGDALRSILTALPASPSQPDVLAALRAGLPAPPVDPGTKLAGVPPQLDAAVNGPTIGVSVRAVPGPGEIDCLFGSRWGSEILVWRPPRVLIQPGETSCDGPSALARLATRPPH